MPASLPQIPLTKIATFCGSSSGINEAFTAKATQLAQEFALQQITCVYGGAKVGIMGTLADTMLAASGKVIGVMPEDLVNKEIAHDNLSELIIVENMHRRKETIYEIADAFILLPGGFGSYEEFIEITTWTQLGYYRKPLGILNVDGFYDGLLSFFQHAAKENFIRQRHLDLINVSDCPKTLLDKMRATDVSFKPKWVDD